MADTRNVIDRYKDREDRLWRWTEDLIKEDLAKTAFPAAVLVENFQGDLNLATIIRSANCFNFREVYYYGKRHYDRRGTVGAHLYTNVKQLKSLEEVKKLKEVYTFVAAENTVPDSVELSNFEWDSNSLIVLGEEGLGISPETLSICDKFVHIPQFGSIRSLNAAVAGSIMMNDFVTKYNKNVKV